LEVSVEVLHPRCAGLDVHRDTVVACARIVDGKQIRHHVEQFGTTTTELHRLRDWLTAHGCTHVVMEATGVYWKPVWNVLHGAAELLLANAAHVKNVPGRKTDVNDATWLSDLLAHGLVRASFVPDKPAQELRALLRTRKQLVRGKGQHVQRIEKVLQDTNIKLSSTVSDIMGQSGRAILQALVDGETDPDRLLALTTGRLKASHSALREDLRGHVSPHHRFLLKLHLEQITHIEAAIAAIDQEVGHDIDPFRQQVALLVTIPGVGDLMAQTIVSEIGTDMTRFPSAGHLLSWAGLCPRNDESAGKRRSTRLRHGTPWLKTQLVQAAWCATRAKQTYLRAQFLRLKARRGPRKAIMAVAASMLTAIYYMLRDGVAYNDLGPDYFDRLDHGKLLRRLVRKIEDLGYDIDLKRVA
jgi:transposase